MFPFLFIATNLRGTGCNIFFMKKEEDDINYLSLLSFHVSDGMNFSTSQIGIILLIASVCVMVVQITVLTKVSCWWVFYLDSIILVTSEHLVLQERWLMSQWVAQSKFAMFRWDLATSRCEFLLSLFMCDRMYQLFIFHNSASFLVCWKWASNIWIQFFSNIKTMRSNAETCSNLR